MTISVVSEGSAPRAQIKHDDVYMIQSKEGLFVHIGSGCSIIEKRNALAHAHVS